MKNYQKERETNKQKAHVNSVENTNKKSFVERGAQTVTVTQERGDIQAS